MTEATNKSVKLQLTDVEAATLDNLLTVHMSQTACTADNSEYFTILEKICASIQTQLGVTQ